MNTENKINWKQDNSIGILKLNNPPENYLEDPEFILLDELKQYVNTEIRGLVITSVGRHFSAGADPNLIMEQIKDTDKFRHQLHKGNALLNYIENLYIPVIAAISGVCFGGGLEIALSCHIRVCSETALFAFPEINHNLFPGMGGIRKLEDLVGRASALELVLTGDIIDATKAYELKLADYLTDRKAALEFSVSLLKKITCDRPLKIINSIMRSVNNSKRMGFEEAVEKDAEMFCELALEEAKRRNLMKED